MYKIGRNPEGLFVYVKKLLISILEKL